MKHLLVILSVMLSLQHVAWGQTNAVSKSTAVATANDITGDLNFPSGKKLKFKSGSTLELEGSVTITGTLNASTATTLQTARLINGVSFNGSADVTVTAAAGTLSGSTLASGVTASSLTSVGTIATGVWQGTAIADSYVASATTWNAKQTGHANLTSLAGVTAAANKLPYFDGTTTMAVTDLSSFVRTFLDDANEAAFRVTTGTDNATNLIQGSLPDGRLSANVSLLGSQISLTTEVGGTLPVANGGTGETSLTAFRLALLPAVSGNAGKFLRVNAGATDYELATIGGGGDALTSGTLGQFAATTSAILRGVISDESGTGVFLTSNGSAADLTNFPTFNQNTSGNAATATALQTGRAINGTTFNGTADITVTAAAGTLTGSTLASGVTTSSLTTVGTIATGVWQGTAVADTYIASASTWNAKQAGSANLTTYSGITPSANVQTFLGAANYAAMKTQLALTIGTDVQAYNSNLADLADGSLTGTAVAAATTSARGSVELATDGETAASVAVQGNDNRLVDAEKVAVVIVCSDETTAVTAGTGKRTIRAPYAFTLTAVRASVVTAPTGSTLIVDVNEGGSTVLGTKLSIDASELTSTTAASSATITDSSIADDSVLTVDFDQVGSSVAGAGVIVTLYGTR